MSFIKSRAIIKIFFLFLVIFIHPTFLLNAEDSEVIITPVIALKATNIFEKKPLTKENSNALAIIVRFAETSVNVTIQISQKFLPWAGQYGKYSQIL